MKSEKKEMNEKQILFAEKIYQINHKFDEFKQKCKFGENPIGFCTLNNHNRKFNWYIVDKERWCFSNKIVGNIKKCCKKEEKIWNSFLTELRQLDNDAINDSIEYFDKFTRSASVNLGDNEEFHFHFLNIYQSYPIHSGKYFDGIVYRNFKKKKKRLINATAELLVDKKATYHVYPWLDITFNYEYSEKEKCIEGIESIESIKRISSQESDSNGCDIVKSEHEVTEMENHFTSNKFTPTNAEQLYYYYLLPIMAGYQHPSHKKICPYDGKYMNKNKYLLDHKHIRLKHKFLLFIPVYDAPITEMHFGNFYGNITVFFENANDRDSFLGVYKKKIEENLFLLVR